MVVISVLLLCLGASVEGQGSFFTTESGETEEHRETNLFSEQFFFSKFSLSSVIVTTQFRTNSNPLQPQRMNETPEPQTRLKTIVVFAMLLVVFGAVIAFGWFATFSRPVTTVFLVRHAEKKIEPNNPDPDLTPAGEARA